jgi:predicted N-acetyltransferase YhbS
MNIRTETAGDDGEVERLTRLGFDKTHSNRNIWQLRKAARLGELCLVAEGSGGDAELLGSIRFWPITLAGLPSVLLGPLAVNPALRGQGIGMALVREGLKRAGQGPWAFCFVSGEPDYYPRLGFSKISAGQVDLPAPIEEERLHLISVSDHEIHSLPPEPWVISSAGADGGE